MPEDENLDERLDRLEQKIKRLERNGRGNSTLIRNLVHAAVTATQHGRVDQEWEPSAETICFCGGDVDYTCTFCRAREELEKQGQNLY